MPQPIKYPELGASLEAVRGNKHSMRYISQITKVDYGHINRVFHGQSLPSREILLRICKVLQCSPQEAAEIFKHTDYRAPDADELEEEERAA